VFPRTAGISTPQDGRGINNIFDKDPPIVSNTTADPSILGNGNTFPGTYDCCGRLVFMNLTMKF